MTEGKALEYAVIGGVALLVWYFATHQQPTVTVADPTSSGNDFYAPFYSTNPGIPDIPQVLNGGNSPFNSAITVNVTSALPSGLANDYMPMFGFVGVTAVGG